MKSIIYFLIAVVFVSIVGYSFLSSPAEIKSLKIGSPLPGELPAMQDVDKREKTLESLKQENGLLVVFSCNTCPFVVGNGEKSEGWETRYLGVYELCLKNKIGMVLINSNTAKRQNVDSMDEMVKRANEKGYRWSYLVDKNNAVADVFGATRTPEVFLFDKASNLAYKGAIDDNVSDAGSVKNHYLKNAISGMANGEKLKTRETKPVGCSIKRFSK